MKIACVAGSFPELSTTFILDQVTGLLERGHDVHVFARTPPKVEPIHADFHKYRLAERTHYWDRKHELGAHTWRLLREKPLTHGLSLLRAHSPFRFGYKALDGRHWLQAATLLMHGPFDVVLCQFGVNGRYTQKLREIGAFDAPVATTWLGYDLSQIVKERGPRYYRDLFAHGDLQLPLQQLFRRRLVELGCPEEKARVHALGIDLRHLPFRQRTLARGETVRIVTVCRLVEKKGLLFALQALAQVAAAGLRFEYHILGDGPLRASLEAVCSELGLRERVTFHGARTRDQVHAALATSHLFLSPSVTADNGDQEGMPVAIMEAMAAGLPVISTFHSGIPELIEDGVSGLLANERDVPRLAQHITTLVASAERWPAISSAARHVIETRHDEGRLNDQLAELLGELASRKSYPAF